MKSRKKINLTTFPEQKNSNKKKMIKFNMEKKKLKEDEIIKKIQFEKLSQIK